MKLVEVLVAARKKIVKGWTMNMTASDNDGQWVEAKSKYATRWCAVGSMQAVAASKEAERAIKFLESTAGTTDISLWNDTKGRTKKQVVALFDKAIKKASAK